MRIGFDAKRLFLNTTGLGNYSRNLVHALAKKHRDEFWLYTTQVTPLLNDEVKKQPNIKVRTAPQSIQSLWRSWGVCHDIQQDQLDIYHGLSNELPFGIKKTGVQSVVTIHDLLFHYYPEDYPFIDRFIYRSKSKYAIEHADRIVATSNATKGDILDFFDVDEEKIQVVFQGCEDRHYTEAPVSLKKQTKAKYALPNEFLLCVGSLTKRKNQLVILQALYMRKQNIDIPLVLVGQGRAYEKQLRRFIVQHKLDKQVVFIPFLHPEELWAIYQLATISIYPSLREGFGIPVLESMANKLPVITSRGTSMEEIVAEESLLVDSTNPEELAEKIEEVLSQDNSALIEKNYDRAMQFSNKNHAQNMYDLYKSLMQ